jgi:hypothetical protein
MPYAGTAIINYKDGTEREVRLDHLSLSDLEKDLHKYLLNLKVSSCVFTIVRTKYRLQETDVDSFDKFF